MPRSDYSALKPFLSFDDMLGLPRLSADDKIRNLVDTVYNKKTLSRPQPRTRPYFWGPERYGLDRCRIFLDATEEQKTLVLGALTNLFLAQGYYIEQSGLSYAAKMILLHNTADEKMLYMAMGADEAVHLREMENFIDFDTRPILMRDTFLHLLQQIQQTCSAEICYALIQVMLEGYGMVFYSMLADHCLDPQFKEVLRRIVKEEAVHHGSGVVLCSKTDFNAEASVVLKEMAAGMVQVFQLWAMPVLTTMETVLGHLSLEQKRRILEEIGMEENTAAKMRDFRAMIDLAKLSAVLDEGWRAKAMAVQGAAAVAALHTQLMSQAERS